ncbi:MAG: hypothetical protein M3Q49_00220, partial [Actinomycetota bacterium]|nr:hypothetical protein [Actinomycetota bacterium]
QAPPPPTLVYVQLLPGPPERFGGPPEVAVPVTEEALEDIAEVCFHSGGSRLVDQNIELLASRKREIETGHGAGSPGSRFFAGELQRAIDLLTEARRDQMERIADALADVDDAARRILAELLKGAQDSCRMGRSGLVEDPINTHPSIDWSRQGELRFRALRAGVVELDGLARAVREAEGAVNPDPLYPRIPGVASAQDPYLLRTRARQEFAVAWRRWVAEYPFLAVAGKRLLAETGDSFEQPELVELSRQRGNYENALDELIRAAVVEVARETLSAGAKLTKEYRAEAQKAREIAADLEVPGDRVYAENHPLWRYPLIVQAALERIGAGPGTLEYAAAMSALERAAELQERKKVKAAGIDEVLGWASLGFGVVALLPVVGQFAALFAGLCATVRMLSAISEYETEEQQRAAFGPLATQFALPDPDGAGLLVKVLGLGAEAVPLLGVPGKFAGRLIRVTATQALVGEAALEAVSLGIDVLALATEAEIERVSALDAATEPENAPVP